MAQLALLLIGLWLYRGQRDAKGGGGGGNDGGGGEGNHEQLYGCSHQRLYCDPAGASPSCDCPGGDVPACSALAAAAAGDPMTSSSRTCWSPVGVDAAAHAHSVLTLRCLDRAQTTHAIGQCACHVIDKLHDGNELDLLRHDVAAASVI